MELDLSNRNNQIITLAVTGGMFAMGGLFIPGWKSKIVCLFIAGGCITGLYLILRGGNNGPQ